MAPHLAQWRARLRERLEEFAVLAHFGETDQTFVLFGWTPEREVPRLRAALAANSDGAVIVQLLPLTPEEKERAPVALENPSPARPFQSLVRLFALPRYHGIDPTLLMAFFMPIFFGMMLGDVGYGALLLLGCLIVLWRVAAVRRSGALRDLVHVLTFGAAWSIVFGFLYGELFGTLGEQLGMHALWLDRTSADQVANLLMFTIAVGVVHITLGLVLGVWESIREHSKSLLLERGGMLIGLIGLFLIVAVAVKGLPPGFMTPGVAVMIVGIVLLAPRSAGWDCSWARSNLSD
jgi:V/A-type H+-transporting ATPase subunit I